MASLSVRAFVTPPTPFMAAWQSLTNNQRDVCDAHAELLRTLDQTRAPENGCAFAHKRVMWMLTATQKQLDGMAADIQGNSIAEATYGVLLQLFESCKRSNEQYVKMDDEKT